MAYQNLAIITPAKFADSLAELLSEAGALSVTMVDAEDEAIFQLEPDERPLWQTVKINALFSKESSPQRVIRHIEQQLKLPSPIHYQIETLPDQDWVRLTQQNFPAKQFGNDLWICPEWENVDNFSGTVVRIDPGLAFGTGTHPTTALCLEWLANHPPKNKDVIDYGCGSGILALAALALGAKTVWAIDHDAQAIEATAQNAELNAFASRDKLHILLPQQLHQVKAPLVIANILAKPLIEMAASLMQHVEHDGQLVLSGILASEIEKVAAAYQPEMKVIESKTQDEWARLVLQRPL